MFEFISKVKLDIKQRLELRRLQKQKDEEIKILRQKKQFEINKTSLEREAELEELKAEVRKNQQKSQPKQGVKQEKKTSFAAFQDYCTNFANQPSFVGDIKLGGENGKNNKGSRKRNRSGIRTGYIRV